MIEPAGERAWPPQSRRQRLGGRQREERKQLRNYAAPAGAQPLVGTQVYALFFGQWHAGTVRGIVDGNVAVYWDDDGTQSHVPVQDVCLR